MKNTQIIQPSQKIYSLILWKCIKFIYTFDMINFHYPRVYFYDLLENCFDLLKLLGCVIDDSWLRNPWWISSDSSWIFLGICPRHMGTPLNFYFWKERIIIIKTKGGNKRSYGWPLCTKFQWGRDVCQIESKNLHINGPTYYSLSSILFSTNTGLNLQ